MAGALHLESRAGQLVKSASLMCRIAVYKRVAQSLCTHEKKCETSAPNPSALSSRRGAMRRPVLSLGLPPRACSQSTILGAFLNKYDLLEVIGSGSTSCVQHAVRRSDGQHLALKKMRSRDPEMISIARGEFELLKKIPPHPHIIQAIDFCGSSQEAVIVMEFFHGRTLYKTVHDAPPKCLPERVACGLSNALFRAVSHLHTHGIVHRDIKPENIIVSSDLTDLRVIDFNVAHSLDDGPSLTPTGTDLYKAPETRNGEALSKPHDVWTAGLCLFFMLSGSLPKLQTDGYGEQMTGTQTVVFEGPRWHHVSEGCKAFLSNCLVVDMDKRPTTSELLEHQWLNHFGCNNVRGPQVNTPRSSEIQMQSDFLQEEFVQRNADHADKFTDFDPALVNLQRPWPSRWAWCGVSLSNGQVSPVGSTVAPSDFGLSSGMVTPTESLASGAVTPATQGSSGLTTALVPAQSQVAAVVSSWLMAGDQFRRIPSGIVNKSRALFERSSSIPSFFVPT